MSPTVQLVLVFAVVLAAAGYVAITVWRRIFSAKTSPGCGTGCGSCGHSSPSSPNVVPLESLATTLEELKPPRN